LINRNVVAHYKEPRKFVCQLHLQLQENVHIWIEECLLTRGWDKCDLLPDMNEHESCPLSGTKVFQSPSHCILAGLGAAHGQPNSDMWITRRWWFSDHGFFLGSHHNFCCMYPLYNKPAARNVISRNINRRVQDSRLGIQNVKGWVFFFLTIESLIFGMYNTTW
jgi:hypothetical protein